MPCRYPGHVTKYGCRIKQHYYPDGTACAVEVALQLTKHSAEYMRYLFRAAGYHSVLYGLARPTQPITAYRGATSHRACGMSWTTDITRS
jgi:hypothetical protein